MLRSAGSLLALVLSCVAIVACRDDPATPGTNDAPEAYNPDWTQATHGQVDPNYGAVLPQDVVNTIEIRMTADQWASVRTNMTQLTGRDFGTGGTGGVPGGAGGGFGGGIGFADPDYVDVTVEFDGRQWKNVGFRLKGNSSLSSIWSAGIYKLPFRLNFDRFEDEVPAIRNQRFYGFTELSMAPAWSDDSLIREKAVADIFRLAGVPAASTAFYRVYIDFGEGLKYVGVYTAVEVIDDTMVEDQFGEDDGNIYKPTSRFVTFAENEFEKKNNATTADYFDVRAVIDALNSPLRTSDPDQWRAELEAVFDVGHFLKWLAVNNAIVNWDSYGSMAHNYYIYDHSERGIIWIPWDHNLSMSGDPDVAGTQNGDGGFPGPGGGFPGGGGFGRGLSLTMDEVDSSWPLIRYLADDAGYFAIYEDGLRSLYENVFTEAAMDALFDRHHNLISPYVVGENGEEQGYTNLSSAAAFTSALGELKTHVRNRRSRIAEFLR